jgi:hypothetical protein
MNARVWCKSEPKNTQALKKFVQEMDSPNGQRWGSLSLREKFPCRLPGCWRSPEFRQQGPRGSQERTQYSLDFKKSLHSQAWEEAPNPIDRERRFYAQVMVFSYRELNPSLLGESRLS